jgi:hypothetical protein
VDPEPECVSGPRGGRESAQAAARVNASLSVSVNNERELTWQTRTDFRHFGTTSITLRVRGTGWNAMKPQIQRVLTQ